MGVVLVTGSSGLMGRGVIRPPANAGYTATLVDNKPGGGGARRMPGETPVWF
jgi:NAD(P)-dependent dehydrogenase (short-subunit alcohol dehydrogenase family)